MNPIKSTKVKSNDCTTVNQSFERLFNEQYLPLVFYAQKMIGCQEMAEDIVQEVFVKFWSKFNWIDSQSYTRNYLYRSVHNLSIDYIRHQKVEMRRLNSYLAHKDDFDVINDLVAQSEVQHGIDKAYESLPERCLQVFQLSRDEGLTYGQIAQKMSISIKTVETQMSKALRIFRRELRGVSLAFD